MTRTRLIRPAFTLVELMVAMALSIGIMWILAESFKMGLDFTRHARSTGEMMNQLNAAGAVLARDLQAPHFTRDDNRPNGGVRLSDQRSDLAGLGWTPPPGGFVRIISPASTFIANDADGFAVTSATNHGLHFTSILSASDQNPYATSVGAATYTSRAAEIALFLDPIPGLKTSGGLSGQQLYNLIRRQRLVALTTDDVGALQGALAGDPTYEVISAAGGAVNTLQSLTVPPFTSVASSRLNPLAALPLSSNRGGEDILLSNVLSFEVLVDWSPSLNGVPGSRLGPRPFSGDPVPAPPAGVDRLPSYPGLANSDAPYDNLVIKGAPNNSVYLNSGVFDTWGALPNWNNFALPNNTNALPLAIRVKSVQITIRVFDTKTRMARQSTWKFSL
jgi:type II secretory pathway pseudopilin PulG